MMIVIIGTGEDLADIPFTLTPVPIGVVTSETAKITNTDGNDVFLPYGTKVLVQIKATTPTGTIETELITVRVSKN